MWFAVTSQFIKSLKPLVHKGLTIIFAVILLFLKKHFKNTP